MNNREIQNIYKKKIKLLKKFNKLYYDENKPIITDSEYDVLKKDILVLERKYKFLVSDDSPSKTVGEVDSLCV